MRIIRLFNIISINKIIINTFNDMLNQIKHGHEIIRNNQSRV